MKFDFKRDYFKFLPKCKELKTHFCFDFVNFSKTILEFYPSVGNSYFVQPDTACTIG